MGTQFHRPKIRADVWRIVESLAVIEGQSTARVLADAIVRAEKGVRGRGTAATKARICGELLKRVVKDLIRYESVLHELRAEVRAKIGAGQIVRCTVLDELDRYLLEIIQLNAALRRDMFAALESSVAKEAKK